MELPGWMMPHTVTVEPLTGTGPYGDVYGPAQTIRCLVEDTRQLVRALDGSEVVSQTTVYAPPGLAAPPDSKVTLPSGRVSYVITASGHDDGGLGGWQHTELNLK